MWSLSQQRCLATYHVHREGVWALQTNEAFTTVYTAGRDRHIWATDLKSNPESRAQTLVAVESAPILKMILTPNQKGLWVSTSESNVKYWDIGDLDYSSSHYHSSSIREDPRFVLTTLDTVVIPAGSTRRTRFRW